VDQAKYRLRSGWSYTLLVFFCDSFQLIFPEFYGWVPAETIYTEAIFDVEGMSVIWEDMDIAAMAQ